MFFWGFILDSNAAAADLGASYLDDKPLECVCHGVDQRNPTENKLCGSDLDTFSEVSLTSGCWWPDDDRSSPLLPPDENAKAGRMKAKEIRIAVWNRIDDSFGG